MLVPARVAGGDVVVALLGNRQEVVVVVTEHGAVCEHRDIRESGKLFQNVVEPSHHRPVVDRFPTGKQAATKFVLLIGDDDSRTGTGRNQCG